MFLFVLFVVNVPLIDCVINWDIVLKVNLINFMIALNEKITILFKNIKLKILCEYLNISCTKK